MDSIALDSVGSLPYLDQVADNSLRENVDQLILEEMKTFEPRDYLSLKNIKPLPSLERYQPEIDRIERGEKIIDTSRYLNEPPEDENDVHEWENAVSNAQGLLEYHNTRLINLLLFSKHGQKKHELWNLQLQQKADRLTKNLKQLKDEITEINKKRKAQQLEALPRMQAYEKEFHDTVRANFEIERAVLGMEKQLEPLRSRFQQHLSLQQAAKEEAAKRDMERRMQETPLPETVARNIRATAAARVSESTRTGPEEDPDRVVVMDDAQ